MKFINNGEAVQVRVGKWPEKVSWVLLQKGETIELLERIGKAYGLEKVNGAQELPEVTEGKIGKTKVETKQFENKKYVSFWNELLKIKGIGLKTAKDIVKNFKTKKDLVKAIKSKEHIPLRDDVVKKLKRKYGK